jgi:Na+-transporting NADH:ubiquinone oxidoreductase subunit C
MQGSKYTIFFTLTMCLLISTLLAGTSWILKDRQDFNKKIDVQKNILSAAGINVANVQDVEETYNKRVKSMFISEDGKITDVVVDGTTDCKQIFKIKTLTDYAFVYPIVGKGLWSTLYGYLAVGASGKSIIGITFYKHGETPGLGAEIEKQWFCDNFIGKTLYNNNKFTGIFVAKGKAKNDVKYKTYPNSIVDGISGATITSKGVEKMLSVVPLQYHSFFNKE